MSLNGRLFEEIPSGPAKPRWQLRIPLPNSQYVNFGRDFDSELNPLVLSAFVAAVQRGLQARSMAPLPEVIRMPAARYYNGSTAAAAAAGNGEFERVAL
jgi:hypothetical protein